ncbi:MAG: hypothetical protein AAF889_07935 [Cyanobacteria bacterium P01_D01_bin.73]
MDKSLTNLAAAKARIRERIKLERAIAEEAWWRRRLLLERSAEIRVASQMDVPSGAIVRGFSGISGRLDTPTYQRSVPYAIGPSPCRCRPRPIRRPVPGKRTKGEVVFIYVSEAIESEEN